MVARVADLGLDEGVPGHEALEPRLAAVLEDPVGQRAVGAVEVAGHVLGEREASHEGQIPVGFEADRAHQRQVGGEGVVARLEAPDLDGRVDGVLRHLAVGGPLAAGDRDKARLAGDDGVVAREAGGVGRAAVVAGLGVSLYQWPQAAPGGEHVSDVDGQVEVLAHVPEDVLDVLGGGAGLGLDLRRVVGGADHGVPQPGQEEEHPAVLGLRYQQAGVRWAEAAGQDGVHARARLEHGRGRRVVEAAHGVGEGARGVDHDLGRDLERLGAGVAVLEHGAAEPAASLEKRRDLDVVHDDGPALGRGEGQRDVHARVVELPVVVLHGAAEALALEHREALAGVGSVDQAARLEVGLAGQHVVELQAGEVVGELEGVVDGREQRQRPSQVRSVLQ